MGCPARHVDDRPGRRILHLVAETEAHRALEHDEALAFVRVRMEGWAFAGGRDRLERQQLPVGLPAAQRKRDPAADRVGDRLAVAWAVDDGLWHFGLLVRVGRS